MILMSVVFYFIFHVSISGLLLTMKRYFSFKRNTTLISKYNIYKCKRITLLVLKNTKGMGPTLEKKSDPTFEDNPDPT